MGGGGANQAGRPREKYLQLDCHTSCGVLCGIQADTTLASSTHFWFLTATVLELLMRHHTRDYTMMT